jgi:hypothetical protein
VSDGHLASDDDPAVGRALGVELKALEAERDAPVPERLPRALRGPGIDALGLDEAPPSENVIIAWKGSWPTVITSTSQVPRIR